MYPGNPNQGPPPNPMNPFAGLQNAPISPKGNPFHNGTYKLDFVRALIKQTQNVGLAFIVEYKILESNHPAHPIGSIASWFQKMQNQAVAFSAIASWYAAHLGYDTSPEALQHFDANVRPHLETLVAGLVQNPAALQGHTTVDLNVKTATSKNRGLPFQLHNFRPWKPPQGWQPQPTPAQPVEPQAPPRQAMAPQGPMSGFAGGAPQPGAYQQAPYGAPAGQQYGAPPQAPMYGTPAPQAPYGQPPQGAPMTAPYGAPAMPPAGPSPYGQPPQQAPAQQPYGVPQGPQGPGGPPGWPQR